MTTILATPEDDLIASALRAHIEAAGAKELIAVSILVCTTALASNPARLKLISQALAAWECSRLLVVRVNDAPLPLGLSDLSSSDLRMIGAEPTSAEIATFLQELPHLSPYANAARDQEEQPDYDLPLSDVRMSKSKLDTSAAGGERERLVVPSEAAQRGATTIIVCCAVFGLGLVVWAAYYQAVYRASELPVADPGPTRVAESLTPAPSAPPRPDITYERLWGDDEELTPSALKEFTQGLLPPAEHPRKALAVDESSSRNATRRAEGGPFSVGDERGRRIGELEKKIAELQQEVEALKQESTSIDPRMDTAEVPAPAPSVPNQPANMPAASTTADLEKLAQGGDSVAQFTLALRYAEGRGVAKDDVKAASLVTKAAKQGLVVAEYRLGAIYERGVGVPKDLGQAKHWYERAAKGGNRKAMHNLAVLHADSQNYPEAARWFRQGAEFGLADSQYNLGILLERGMGVRKNASEAAKWYSIALAQGDTDAAERFDALRKLLNPSEIKRAENAARAFSVKPIDLHANSIPEPSDETQMPSKRGSADEEPTPTPTPDINPNPPFGTEADVPSRATSGATILPGVAVLIATLALAFFAVAWRIARKRAHKEPLLAEPRPMSDNPTRSVFASYAREDSIRVDSILSVVEGSQFAIWIDRRKLPGGARWPEEIVKAIRQCHACIVFCSERSFRSDDVFREVHIAGRLGKRLIPVALDKSAMPDQFLYFLAAQNVVEDPNDLGVALRAIA